MRSHRLFTTAAAAFLLAAGGALAAPAGPVCTRLDVGTSPVLKPAATVTFRATEIVDLTLSLYFLDTSAAGHLAELRLFVPDGSLYRSLIRPIASAGRSPGTRQVRDYPRPLREQPLVAVETPEGTLYRLDFTFPVGGTDIVANGLYGSWRAEPYLDGSTAPCARARTFVLAP